MKRYLPIALTALLLAGCASYHAAPLSQLSPDVIQSRSTKNQDVLIAAKAFDRMDCKRYLDRDVIRQGYRPVQLYIRNNTDKNYIFALNRMGLPLARPEEVAQRVHTSTVGRAIGYGVGSLILWPLIIPAIVDGMGSAEANTLLDADFYSKTAKDQVIAGHSHLNTLVFVPNFGFKSEFTLTLIDQESAEPRSFDVVIN